MSLNELNIYNYCYVVVLKLAMHKNKLGKFKNRQNKLMVVKVRVEFPSGLGVDID